MSNLSDAEEFLFLSTFFLKPTILMNLLILPIFFAFLFFFPYGKSWFPASGDALSLIGKSARSFGPPRDPNSPGQSQKVIVWILHDLPRGAPKAVPEFLKYWNDRWSMIDARSSIISHRWPIIHRSSSVDDWSWLPVHSSWSWLPSRIQRTWNIAQTLPLWK